MQPRKRTATLLFSVVILAGCASTNVTEQTPISKEAIARPNRILVYDFAATPADIPADSAVAGQVSAPSAPPSAEDIETGRKLGALIAQRLAEDIQEMGIPAFRAQAGASPQVGDGVIRGYLVSTEAGRTGRRFIIGFGAGKAEMETVVEGYVMTPQGLRRLGSGKLSAAGGKTPGMVMPAAVAIASGNPIGVAVIGGAKIYGEMSGRSGLEGRAKATADEIAEQLKIRFRERGWING
jgi:hypothetical protein